MENIKGKNFFIMGIANEKSLAYGCASKLAKAGANLYFSYPNEAIEKRIKPIAESLGFPKNVFVCDVEKDSDINKLNEFVPNLDGFIHSVAFADKSDLEGAFSNTTRQGFTKALDVSCYSFIGSCRALKSKFNPYASIVTMSYLGGVRVVPNYNIMGVAKAALECSVRYLALEFGQEKKVRVNAISAGPVRTLAASGVKGLRGMIDTFAQRSPIPEAIDNEDVGSSCLFLMSDLSKHITGETLYVDSGYNILGA